MDIGSEGRCLTAQHCQGLYRHVHAQNPTVGSKVPYLRMLSDVGHIMDRYRCRPAPSLYTTDCPFRQSIVSAAPPLKTSIL